MGGGDPWEVVELSAPGGELVARFALAAGAVCCSLRHRGEELLWHGAGLEAYARDGTLFGIPVLHPWANRLRDWGYTAAGRTVLLDRGSPLLQAEEHGLPAHGFVAAGGRWELVGRGDDARAAWLTAALDTAARPELLAVFPFAHRLTVAVRLGPRALRVETALHAGDAPVPMCFGVHPFLAPPGAPREEWVVELPARDALALDYRNLPTGATAPRPPERAPLGERALDDHLALAGVPARFAVAAGRRRLVVEMGAGFTHAQVFAPLAEPVVSFEPMTAPVDALRSGQGLRLVAPGETARAAWTLHVEDGAG